MFRCFFREQSSHHILCDSILVKIKNGEQAIDLVLTGGTYTTSVIVEAYSLIELLNEKQQILV